MGGEARQHNKSHKAGRKAGQSAREKHKTKKAAVPGAASRLTVKAQSRAGTLGAKAERQQKAAAQRQARREAALAARRNAGVLAPRVVAILPLSANLPYAEFARALTDACADGTAYDAGSEFVGMPERAAQAAQKGLVEPVTVRSVKNKQRFTLISLPPADIPASLDGLKAADVLLVLAPPGEALAGQLRLHDMDVPCLAALRAQGLPPTVVALPGLEGIATAKRNSAKKAVTEVLARRMQLARDSKALGVGSSAEFAELVRTLAGTRPSPPAWREQRPYLFAENLDFVPNPVVPDGPGTLCLSAYVRGQAITADMLIALPFGGEYQIELIDAPEDPFPLSAPRQPHALKPGSSAMATEEPPPPDTPFVISVPGQGREALVRENIPDPLAGEQTWPTEEEMMEAEEEGKQRKKRLVPKGTSAYQATWILDEDDEAEEGDEADGDEQDEDEGAMEMDGANLNEAGLEGADFDDDDDEEEEDDEEELEEVGDEGEESNERNARQAALDDLQRRAEERAARADEDAEFPDEVDTPLETPARTRFGRYRGLKSFRTTPWDAKESLPQEYARIFAFQNPKRAHRQALYALESMAETSQCTPGRWIRVRVAGVPLSVAQQVISMTGPCVAVGLLQHECKMSVVHFALKRLPRGASPLGYDGPIAGKEELVFDYGFFRRRARPIYSADSSGDKHKLERFLRHGQAVVATVYAPIAYPPLPLLLFKETEHEPALVGAGRLLSADPDRIVLKRIVLSGVPHKVHKKKVVVKFMFHNPDDVRWFKPLELWTKFGRHGRIKEPVGTHGTMKCLFDGTVTQRDSICASLYKRVFPPYPSST
eukprot:CAMPEP_0170133566 /NCGR_PEP_ID=MMETSP0033_2-20121228/1390_1 /TAXON_ID=195969 /ORGANISM="Dolichomastix tenuilepis, Strain CCMP3274" /LENGTH=828 /DNA_ID=CAMNT_0010369065 /DNA_START=13 /DNA_END=2499 /DNA_ORIENTATION=+